MLEKSARREKRVKTIIRSSCSNSKGKSPFYGLSLLLLQQEKKTKTKRLHCDAALTFEAVLSVRSKRKNRPPLPPTDEATAFLFLQRQLQPKFSVDDDEEQELAVSSTTFHRTIFMLFLLQWLTVGIFPTSADDDNIFFSLFISLKHLLRVTSDVTEYKDQTTTAKALDVVVVVVVGTGQPILNFLKSKMRRAKFLPLPPPPSIPDVIALALDNRAATAATAAAVRRH